MTQILPGTGTGRGGAGVGWGSLGGVSATDKKTGKVYNVLLLIMTGGCRLVSQCHKTTIKLYMFWIIEFVN